MDVIYPYANKSRSGDDWELRYSLRSLEQQPWVDSVYIIGYIPKWVKNVIWIHCPDPYISCKDANIINKILVACADRAVSENFVVNSDDQYILKPIGEEDLKAVIENPDRLKEYQRIATTNGWPKRLMDTVNWCKANGCDPWIFNSHIPYVVNKYDYPFCMCRLAWGQGNGYTTHAYLNMALDYVPEKEPVGRTIRVKSRVNESDFKNKINDAMFLNHNDSGLITVVKTFLENRFPNKSRWEK